MSLASAAVEGLVTSDAEREIADRGLQDAYETVLGIVSEMPSCQHVTVSITPYDDSSGLSLIDIELRCGLSGREAIDARNRLRERMRGELGVETANRFLLVVR